MRERTASLVRRAQRGDAGAFGALVERFQDAVFGAAYATVRNFHDAEDIAQDAFLAAYKELPGLREPSKFPAWLHRIAINACHGFLSARREQPADVSTFAELPAEQPSPDEAAEARDLRQRVMEQIGKLSDGNRLVTVLFLINGYSHKDISDFLDIPVSTVKSRLHESRKQLQRRLVKVAEGILHDSRPGGEFIRKLRERLHGRIIELPDGRVQVFYDFEGEKELRDWRVHAPYEAAPKVRDGKLVFGRVEAQETEKQWDRNIRLNLVLSPPLEITYEVSLGTNEPWSDAGWALTQREGYGEGIRFFHGVIWDWSAEWRRERQPNDFRGGCLKASFLRRCSVANEETKPVAPFRDVPLTDVYQMRVTRQGRRLRWEVNGQLIGEARIADDEVNLTERFILLNQGKGTGAAFRNLVIRAGKVEYDPLWPEVDGAAGVGGVTE